jgi:hypothetical protein
MVSSLRDFFMDIIELIGHSYHEMNTGYSFSSLTPKPSVEFLVFSGWNSFASFFFPCFYFELCSCVIDWLAGVLIIVIFPLT